MLEIMLKILRAFKFLLYIQVYHNSIARKIRNIRAGVAFPKERREIDVWIDNQIREAVASRILFILSL